MPATAHLIIYRTFFSRRNQRWRWRLTVNGKGVATSGEGYSDRAEAKEMGQKVCTGKYYVEMKYS